MENIGTEEPRAARPAGRPRKPKAPLPDVRGVVYDPEDEANIIEFKSQFAGVFKHLASYYRSVAVTEIAIIFGMNFVELQGYDHFRVVHSRTRFDCTKTMQYYCDKPMTIYITRDKFEREFHQLDVNVTSVTLSLEHETYRHKLFVTTDVKVLGSKRITPIKTIVGSPEDINDDHLFIDSDNHVNYRFVTKSLKKQLSHWAKKDTYFRFTKRADKPLSIVSLHKTDVISELTFNDRELVDERCHLFNREVSFTVSSIFLQPIIASNMHEKLIFRVDEFYNDRMPLFMYEGDGWYTRFLINVPLDMKG